MGAGLYASPGVGCLVPWSEWLFSPMVITMTQSDRLPKVGLPNQPLSSQAERGHWVKEPFWFKMVP